MNGRRQHVIKDLDPECGWLHWMAPGDLVERLEIQRAVTRGGIVVVMVMLVSELIATVLLLFGELARSELPIFLYIWPTGLLLAFYFYAAAQLLHDRSLAQPQRKHTCALPRSLRLRTVSVLVVTLRILPIYLFIQASVWEKVHFYPLLGTQIAVSVGGVFALTWAHRGYARANGEAQAILHASQSGQVEKY